MKKIELIEIGLHEIERQCHVISRLQEETEKAIAIHKAKGVEPDEVFITLEERYASVLSMLHDKVKDLLNLTGNVLNFNGAITEEDVYISNSVYDLVFERNTEESLVVEKEDTPIKPYIGTKNIEMKYYVSNQDKK